MDILVKWSLTGILIQATYLWFKWVDWKRPWVYIMGAICGPLMLIVILYIERYE